MVHSFRRSQGAWSVGASAPASTNSESSKGAATGGPPASPCSCCLPSLSMDSSGAADRTGTEPAPSSPSSSLTRRRRLDYRKACASAGKKSGMSGRLQHDLRRTMARNLVGAGVARARGVDDHPIQDARRQSAHFFPLRGLRKRAQPQGTGGRGARPSSTPPIPWPASSLIRGCYHRRNQGMPKPSTFPPAEGTQKVAPTGTGGLHWRW